MKTLIMHHVESMWESSYLKIGGLSFESLLYKFCEHLECEQYDRVILTRFEDCRLEAEHGIIAEYITEVHEYAYGWESCEETQGDDFCEGGNHSERVLIADWMKTLCGEVYVSGAFEGECLEDLEIALDHVGVKYSKVRNLVM